MSKPPSSKKIRRIQLIAVIFFTVSGGPYGLENLLTYAGEHGALMLLLITPLLWDLPAILTVLELNSMMPITGGYYKWVKHTLGNRWGFFEGWWTWPGFTPLLTLPFTRVCLYCTHPIFFLK
jgi:amino acid transporter